MTLLGKKEGGNFFFSLPRMLLHRPPRGGQVGRAKLIMPI